MAYLKECAIFEEKFLQTFSEDYLEELIIISDDIEKIEYIKQHVIRSRWSDILMLGGVNGTYIGNKAKIFNIAYCSGVI